MDLVERIVVGQTTAVVAPTPYVPPYKYVTSYAPAPDVTGSVTRPVSNNPTVAPGSSTGDYASAYLSAHMMSWPSYRYIYLLWIVLALIGLLYTLSHHLHLRSSSLGASISKWAIRRYPIGKRRSGGARGRALASNGILLLSFTIFIVAVALTFLGPDYIVPTASVFAFRRQLLLPGQIQPASPSYTISKSIWTIASRLGDTAFALTPLTVLLAMKSPPVAILAWRGLAHLYSDKLATFHKVTAWMVWGATTAHVALWTVQLFMDKRNGSAAWFAMWTNYRFVAGAVAYAAMTGVMVASFRIVRQKQYEFFYITHVTLVFLTIALSALHHPVLWFWMAAAMLLWGLERLFRLVRFWRINGFTSPSSRTTTKSTFLASQYEDLPQADSYALADFPSRSTYVDKSLPRPPGFNEKKNGGSDSPGEWSPASTPRGSFDAGRDEFGRHSRGESGGYADGSLQATGTFDGRYSGADFSNPYDVYDSRPKRGQPPNSSIQNERSLPSHPSQPRSLSNSGLIPIPVGYALAQLLPSRTIRLTIRTPHKFNWVPGQSVLLYLPELSKLQSHPFTITNPSNSDGEIVLLVKARKGLTRQLHDLVRDRHSSNMLLTSNRDSRGKTDSSPIMIRAKVDGPFGSAARVRWKEHSTVVIVCGGSGVSFGVAVLEGLCMAMREGRAGRTNRVRFCWIAREFAEIAWVAHQLQRCRSLVAPALLQIEIYITNSTPLPLRSRQSHHTAYEQPSQATSADDLAPPRAAFAKHSPRVPSSDGMGRRSTSVDSISSLASDMSVDHPQGRGYSDTLEVDQHVAENYADVVDLTNYEDEEDIMDPREEALSSNVREEGKIRRARSRKAVRTKAGGRASTLVPGGNSGMPPSRLSGNIGRYLDGEGEGSRGRGMPNSTSVPSGLVAPEGSPRGNGRSSGYGSPNVGPIDPYADPRDGSGGRRSLDSRPTSVDPRRSRPSTSYDPPTNRPTSHHAIKPNTLAPPPSIRPANTAGSRNSYASSFADPYAAYDPFNGSGSGSGGFGHSSPAASIHYGMFGDDGDRGSIAGDSIRPIYPSGSDTPRSGGLRASRTGSMVLLDEAALGSPRVEDKRERKRSGGRPQVPEGLWIDMADYEAMVDLSELAISGKPALGALLEEEIERSQGSLIVTTCGPTTLNTVVRNLVSKHISPSSIRKGDKRGHIAIYSEDYDG